MMESQGLISEREKWRLATSDKWVALFHELLLREIDKVERGIDPLGVARHPEDATVTPVLWEPTGRFPRRGIRLYPQEPAAVAPLVAR